MPGEFRIGFGDMGGDVNLSPSGDLVEAASRLFDLLHIAEDSGRDAIAIAPVPDTGLGRAINDRLRRAAAERPLRRSEEHTSELQSLMRISYAVFCLKTKTNNIQQTGR